MKQSSIWNSVGSWQIPVCWFGSFLYGSGGFIVREFEPFLDKQVGNLVGGAMWGSSKSTNAKFGASNEFKNQSVKF